MGNATMRNDMSGTNLRSILSAHAKQEEQDELERCYMPLDPYWEGHLWGTFAPDAAAALQHRAAWPLHLQLRDALGVAMQEELELRSVAVHEQVVIADLRRELGDHVGGGHKSRELGGK